MAGTETTLGAPHGVVSRSAYGRLQASGDAVDGCGPRQLRTNCTSAPRSEGWAANGLGARSCW